MPARVLATVGLVVLVFACSKSPPPEAEQKADEQAKAEPAAPSAASDEPLASMPKPPPPRPRGPIPAHAAEWPRLDVTIDPAEFDQLREHSRERGEKWERKAHVRFSRGDELVFEADAGLRLHGFSSRNWPVKNIRLYFRKKHGTPSIEPGILLPEKAGPVRTVVVRREMQKWSSPMSYEVFERLGGTAPVFRPVVYSLNGKVQGAWYMVEHVSKRQWPSRVGHDDLVVHRYKSGDEVPKEVQALQEWVSTLPKMTMAEVGTRIDFDNLMTWLFATVLLGVHDGDQSVAILDRKAEPVRWRWIAWDMDHAFVDYGAGWLQGKRPVSEQEVWDLVRTDYSYRDQERKPRPPERGDERSVIFTRLLKDDPEFPAWLARFVVHKLNHRVTQPFLDDLQARFETLVGSDYPDARREFIANRRAHVLAETRKLLDLSAPIEVEVRAPEGTALTIDGEPATVPYRGRYFRGQHITVAPPAGTAAKWKVNGAKQDADALDLEVKRKTVIELL